MEDRAQPEQTSSENSDRRQPAYDYLVSIQRGYDDQGLADFVIQNLLAERSHIDKTDLEQVSSRRNARFPRVQKSHY